MRLIFTLLLLALGVRAAEPAFSDLARPRMPVAGAPKYSDVIVRNVHPHPFAGNVIDPHDTLRMIGEFHVTRLEWTYRLEPPFVLTLKSLGLTVGGAIEDDSGSRSRLGRVTGADGALVTHRWFPKDRLVGCVNAPEFRAAWLEEAKHAIDAGVDVMQQDDPQMALRTDPPLCYCAYCRAGFEKYIQQHGPGAVYADFQKKSVLAFHREMHALLDRHAGRHIPFSHNSTLGLMGKPDWVSPAFDYVNAEIDSARAEPAKFLPIVAAAAGMPLVFSYRETDLAKNRRFFALTYATGAWMMLPWDVFLPGGQPRYFATAAEFADLSGFVRANATYLDGYEAATTGASSPEALRIEGGSGQVFLAARGLPGERRAPVVLHAIDYGAEPASFTLLIKASALQAARVDVRLREPVPYDLELHATATQTGDYSRLTHETSPPTTLQDGWLRVRMPPLHPWALLVLTPAD